MSLSTIKIWPHNTVVAAAGITPDPLGRTLTVVGAKTVDTGVVILEQSTGFSCIFQNVTSDAAGTYTVFASNDWEPKTQTGNFVDVTSFFTAVAAVAGANINTIFNADGFQFLAVRLRYVQSAGTNIITARLGAKGR